MREGLVQGTGLLIWRLIFAGIKITSVFSYGHSVRFMRPGIFMQKKVLR